MPTHRNTIVDVLSVDELLLCILEYLEPTPRRPRGAVDTSGRTEQDTHLAAVATGSSSSTHASLSALAVFYRWSYLSTDRTIDDARFAATHNGVTKDAYMDTILTYAYEAPVDFVDVSQNPGPRRMASRRHQIGSGDGSLQRCGRNVLALSSCCKTLRARLVESEYWRNRCVLQFNGVGSRAVRRAATDSDGCCDSEVGSDGDAAASCSDLPLYGNWMGVFQACARDTYGAIYQPPPPSNSGSDADEMLRRTRTIGNRRGTANNGSSLSSADGPLAPRGSGFFAAFAATLGLSRSSPPARRPLDVVAQGLGTNASVLFGTKSRTIVIASLMEGAYYLRDFLRMTTAACERCCPRDVTLHDATVSVCGTPVSLVYTSVRVDVPDVCGVRRSGAATEPVVVHLIGVDLNRCRVIDLGEVLGDEIHSVVYVGDAACVLSPLLQPVAPAAPRPSSSQGKTVDRAQLVLPRRAVDGLLDVDAVSQLSDGIEEYLYAISRNVFLKRMPHVVAALGMLEQAAASCPLTLFEVARSFDQLADEARATTTTTLSTRPRAVYGASLSLPATLRRMVEDLLTL